ncbi:MAG: hypothetical protein OXN83_04065 [Oligoflexia bacterium]|nr:hypothetical protein [Oligoflexia bacterium]
MRRAFFLINFAFSYLLLNSLALAEMKALFLRVKSDGQKRAFIESLAETSQEKQVFYRWQSEKVANNLLRAGEMTPQIYNHFMSKNDTWAGAGLYVAEDIVSSHMYGNAIIQVELEPGYRYLNLRDKEVLEKLKSAGLTNKDVYELNPRVAVTDIKEGQPYWVLKKQEGVTFKTFSPQGIPLKDLETAFILKRSPAFLSIIQEETLRRAKQDLSSIVASPLIEVLETEYSEQSIRSAVRNRISSLENIEEGRNLLIFTEKYLELEDEKALVRNILPLIKTVKEGNRFLFDTQKYLEPEEQKTVLRKTISLIETLEEAESTLRRAKDFIAPEERKIILSKTLSLIHTVQEAGILSLLNNHIEPKEMNRIVRKMISRIKTTEDGIHLLSFKNLNFLTPEDIKTIVRKTISLIKTLEEARNTLLWTSKFIAPEERKIILSKTLSLIQTAEEGQQFLKAGKIYLQTEENKQIAHRILELNGDLTELKEILTEEEYRAVKTEYENSSRRIKARLDCLKRQLSSL